MAYEFKTPTYEVVVNHMGEVHLRDPRNANGRVRFHREDWRDIVEDVNAIIHLRKRAGDWDEN